MFQYKFCSRLSTWPLPMLLQALPWVLIAVSVQPRGKLEGCTVISGLFIMRNHTTNYLTPQRTCRTTSFFMKSPLESFLGTLLCCCQINWCSSFSYHLWDRHALSSLIYVMIDCDISTFKSVSNMCTTIMTKCMSKEYVKNYFIGVSVEFLKKCVCVLYRPFSWYCI